jgi:hypothetical protein
MQAPATNYNHNKETSEGLYEGFTPDKDFRKSQGQQINAVVVLDKREVDGKVEKEKLIFVVEGRNNVHIRRKKGGIVYAAH